MDFLAIVGPTGSGKTDLSLAVGGSLGAEIISMDSRQIYRGMDIGTGKVGLTERALIPHHGLDIRDPDQTYSAGQFSRDARGWIRDIRSRGRVPLVVGGTGFFLRALTHPLFAQPHLDEYRVERLRSFLNEMSLERLEAYVRTLDPARAGSALEGGRQRMTRTVEMALLSGYPLSLWHREEAVDQEPLRGLVVVLELPREILYGRINARVGGMVEDGLVEEVERLLEAGYSPEDPGMTGAGYREMIGVVRGEATLSEATDHVRQAHRRYARRQLTWFRHQLQPDPLRLDATGPRSELSAQIRDVWGRDDPATPELSRATKKTSRIDHDPREGMERE
jgi:tRNA dimethylallyltransferase